MPRRATRNTALAVAAAVLFVLTATRLRHPVDLTANLREFSEVERKAVTAYNADLQRAHNEHLRDEQLADMIDKDVLPGWSAERDKLSKINKSGLPDANQRLMSLLVQYMDERQQAWTLLAQALRQHDFNLVRQAMQKQRQAEQLMRSKPAPAH